MFAAVLTFDLHMPLVDSLKERRSVLSPILHGARRRFEIAAAEVGDPDRLRFGRLAFATVGARPSVVTETLDAVERFVWSFPEVEVSDSWRTWLDNEEAR